MISLDIGDEYTFCRCLRCIISVFFAHNIKGVSLSHE